MRWAWLQRARRGAPSAAPRPVPTPIPRISMRPAEGWPGGEGGSGIAVRGALWAALASAGDHLLAVNASPARLGRHRDNGGGGLRSVCVSSGCGGGAGPELLSSLQPPDPSARLWGPRPPWRAPQLAAAPRALQRHPSCLHSQRWLESRGGAESKRAGRKNPPIGRELRPPRLPGAAWAVTQAHRPAARSRGGGPPAGALGAWRSAVLCAPQSLGNHSGVSIGAGNSPAPVTEATDNFDTSHMTFRSAAQDPRH